MFNAILVNLPVESLKRSVEFFTELGFKFNAQFTAETSPCMIVGQNLYVMLLEHSKFSGFVEKPIAGKDTVEAILAFSCESSEQVRELSEKAFALGARQMNDAVDHGFMFSWGFEDLDGHLWELFWMNPDYVEEPAA